MGLTNTKQKSSYTLEKLNYEPIDDGSYEIINIHNNQDIDTVFEFYLITINSIFQNIKKTLFNKNTNLNFKDDIRMYIDEFELIVKHLIEYINCLNYVNYNYNKKKIILFKNIIIKIILINKSQFVL